MELHINDVAARTNAGDWLQQSRVGFLESLAVQGYLNRAEFTGGSNS